MEYLLGKDWVEFERCYPSGTAWLRGRNLWREREALHHEIEVTLDRRRAEYQEAEEMTYEEIIEWLGQNTVYGEVEPNLYLPEPCTHGVVFMAF